jgi:hypothetical protein
MKASREVEQGAVWGLPIKKEVEVQKPSKASWREVDPAKSSNRVLVLITSHPAAIDLKPWLIVHS